MFSLMMKNWWAVVLRGAVALFFGIAALAWPSLTVTALLALFGAFALVDGVFALAALLFGRGKTTWWVQLVEGLLSVLAGLVTFAWPGLTATAFVFIIATWAVLAGLLRIVVAVRLRKAIDNEWVLGLGGALSILVGLIFFARPGVGILSLVWVLGLYAILFGMMLIFLGFRLRGLDERMARGVDGSGGRPDGGSVAR